MNLPRLKVSWKALAMNLAAAALLLFGAPAFGQSDQADVVEPSSKTKWRLQSVSGQNVSIYSLTTGKPKFVGSIAPQNKTQALQQMDKLLETARMAGFRKVTGPHRENVADGAGPLNIRFEVNNGVQSASVFSAKLTIPEAKGLRDLIWRLDSFAGQIKR